MKAQEEIVTLPSRLAAVALNATQRGQTPMEGKTLRHDAS
jgi:hypothetical protein